MTRNFKEAIQNRRSYYGLSDSSLISDKEIEDIVTFALTNIPSCFNSQSTRIVLLIGENHKKLWEITKDTLKKIVPAESFSATKDKINTSFAAGYGTILFYEDQEVVKAMQKTFPTYSNKFPEWSQHTSAMHQLAIWTMLEDAGFGASLQHYNPIIDVEVGKTWNINSNWTLIAQMPFGVPTQNPGEKQFQPIKERLLVFK